MGTEITSATVGAVLDYVGSELSPEQGSVMRSALRRVFHTVYGPEWRHLNIRDIDIDGTMAKFAEVSEIDYTGHSLRSYKSRITRALQMYEESIVAAHNKKNSVHHSPEDEEKAQRAKRNHYVHGTYLHGEAPRSHVVSYRYNGMHELISYPFPLSDGQIVRLHLPMRLGAKDAKRLISFIETITIDNDEEVIKNK